MTNEVYATIFNLEVYCAICGRCCMAHFKLEGNMMRTAFYVLRDDMSDVKLLRAWLLDDIKHWHEHGKLQEIAKHEAEEVIKKFKEAGAIK